MAALWLGVPGEAMTDRLANAESLEQTLAADDVHPNLAELYAEFIP